MDIGLIALLVLFAVIAIGFWRKLNVGLLAIAAAVILGYASGMFTSKQIIAGFSGSLFMTLLGVTFFFGVVQSNGCLEKLMNKAVGLCGKQVWIIPILMYIIGWAIAGIGPGCVPALAFVAAIAIPLAHETGYSPVMLMLIGMMASYSGRFTPITPEGVLITKLMGEQGLEVNMMAIALNTGVGTIILSIIVFLFYKGWKVKAVEKVEGAVKVEPFNAKQLIALAGILVMIVLVIFLKMDVGLASFLVAAVLTLIGCGDEKIAIKSIPWGTLIMVTGVGVLMNLVISTGGIDILASTLASFMNPFTAPALTGLTAGVMSWFSSAIGVVFPTMIPTLGQIATTVGGGVTAVALVSMVSITASFAGISPASTAGALIMAAHDSDSEFSKAKPSGRLFLECFGWSVFCVLFLCAISMTGILSIFH